MKDDEQNAPGAADGGTSEDDTRELDIEGTQEQPVPQETATQAELDELRQKAEERDRFLDQLQHVTADFINYQKRMRKERENIRQNALRDLMEALLPVIDNLEHAIAAAKDLPDKALLEGVTLARDEAQRVFANFGVHPISPVVGQKFDPSLHEAVMVEENGSQPDGTVLEEIRTGYSLDGKTIRATRVKVSRRPQPAQG